MSLKLLVLAVGLYRQKRQGGITGLTKTKGAALLFSRVKQLIYPFNQVAARAEVSGQTVMPAAGKLARL